MTIRRTHSTDRVHTRIRRAVVSTVIGSLVLCGLSIPNHIAQADNFFVTTCNAADLVAAVENANVNGASDTINLKAGCTYNFTFASYTDPYSNRAFPRIRQDGFSGSSISIQGNGAILSRSTAPGTPAFGLVYQEANSSFSMSNLTVENFVATYGGVADGDQDYSFSTSKVTFRNNTASGYGGAVYCNFEARCTITDSYATGNRAYGGGAIYSDGRPTISYSSFFDNSAFIGGAIFTALGTNLVLYSTFAGNTAGLHGGAIFSDEGDLRLLNSTLTNNIADNDQQSGGDGGGVYSYTTSTTSALPQVRNSIIAGNIDNTPGANINRDVYGSFQPDGQNNIIGVGNGGVGFYNGTNGNHVGTTTTPLDPRLIYTPARVDRVNPTYNPLPNSTAINGGDGSIYGFSRNVDGRGSQKPQYGFVDIGAVEYKRPDSPVVINPVNAAWLFRNTPTSGDADFSFLYAQGYVNLPIVGDWNGDGIDTQGAFIRFPASNVSVFALSNAFNSFDSVNLPAFAYTNADEVWRPVAGDWTNVGTTSIGAYNVSTGLWSLNNQNASDAPEYAFIFGGGESLLPLTGDWDGDGYSTVGVYDVNTGVWTLSNVTVFSQTAAVSLQFAFSAPGYSPVVGDWNGDGLDTVGLYNADTGRWLIRNSNTAGDPESIFVYGTAAGLRGLSGQFREVTFGNGGSPARETGTRDAPQIAPTFAP